MDKIIELEKRLKKYIGAENEAMDNVVYMGLQLVDIAKSLESQLILEKQKISIQNPIAESNFNLIWNRYPKKIGKKEAFRHFKASVKTEQDLKDINIALDNYCKTKNVIEGNVEYIQGAGRWFNNWRDWIDVQTTKSKFEPKSGIAALREMGEA